MTALYGQTGDSLTCYTNAELQRIAQKLVYANECDTLLKIAEKQLVLKDTAIVNLNKALNAKDTALVQKDEIIVIKDKIITEKDTEITDLTKANTKLKRQKKFLKAGLSTTGTLLLGAIAFIWITN